MAIDTREYSYLIDSAFQIESVAGKPLVGGWIEVYLAGTDIKYITLQDFDGTENPFKIPLRNDGRAVVLVSVAEMYDYYVYDSFGNLAFSRLNVMPSIGGDVTITGITEVKHDKTLTGNGKSSSVLGCNDYWVPIKDEAGGITLTGRDGTSYSANYVSVTPNNTGWQNEAHVRNFTKYTDGKTSWQELDGADGGQIQLQWMPYDGPAETTHTAAMMITNGNITYYSGAVPGQVQAIWDIRSINNTTNSNNYTLYANSGTWNNVTAKADKSDFWFDSYDHLGSVSGKGIAAVWAEEAQKAQKDSSGNVITDTYLDVSDKNFEGGWVTLNTSGYIVNTSGDYDTSANAAVFSYEGTPIFQAAKPSLSLASQLVPNGVTIYNNDYNELAKYHYNDMSIGDKSFTGLYSVVSTNSGSWAEHHVIGTIEV